MAKDWQTLAEAMAIAVLRGDTAAAYALADRLTDQRADDPGERCRPAADSGAMPMGREVWQWPEFIAFARRLGVTDWLRTVQLTIHIPANGVVALDQSYVASDRQAEGP